MATPGDTLTILHTFTDAAGAPVDADPVTVEIRDEWGTLRETVSDPENPEVGMYRTDYTLPAGVRVVQYTWRGTVEGRPRVARGWTPGVMVELEDLKAELRIDGDGEDRILADRERAAVAAVERWTGRWFGPPRQFVQVLRSSGEPVLFLDETPLADPAPVVKRDGVTVDAAEYVFRGARLHPSGPWGGGFHPVDVEVTYTAGYTAGAVPHDVRQAVLQLVGLWHEMRLPVALGTVAPEVPLTVRDLLHPYRRVRA